MIAFFSTKEPIDFKSIDSALSSTYTVYGLIDLCVFLHMYFYILHLFLTQNTVVDLTAYIICEAG